MSIQCGIYNNYVSGVQDKTDRQSCMNSVYQALHGPFLIVVQKNMESVAELHFQITVANVILCFIKKL